jgi:hypothetical protein
MEKKNPTTMGCWLQYLTNVRRENTHVHTNTHTHIQETSETNHAASYKGVASFVDGDNDFIHHFEDCDFINQRFWGANPRPHTC